ncbi:MAG: pilus assembly protein [Desulfobulbia bacterium]
MPTDNRDVRRIYNDYLSTTDPNALATKNVYYTPFHRGISSFFFNIDRVDHLGGSDPAGLFTIMFSMAATTFDAATDMTGGTCVSAAGADLTQGFTNGNNNGDTGYSANGYVVAVKVETANQPVAGIIQNLASDVRFGYMQFNYGTGPGEGYTRNNVAGNWNVDNFEDTTTEITWRYADGGRVRNFVGDTSTATDPHLSTVLQIVNNINNQNIQMNTPLEEVLWEAGRYFQQLPPAYQPEDNPSTPPNNAVDYEVSQTWDPYYFSDFNNGDGTYGRYVPCAKSFIIFISDGEGNNNSGLPTSTWPTGANTNTLNGDGSGYLDDIAYNLHVKDLRNDVTAFGKATDTILQTITLYTVFTFDDSPTAKATMMKAARAGGFVDLNLDNNTDGTASDTNPLAFVGSPEWDSDGDNVPDTYFEAQDGSEMETKLQAALTDILKKTSAGSAISVLSERSASGAVVHQALFFPEKTFNSIYKVKWPGTLNAYWYNNTLTAQNIREDNTNSFFLDTLADNVLDFQIDTSGNLQIDYYGTTPLGALDPSNKLGTYTNIDDVHKIWEGGEKLKNRAGSDRTIYGVNESGVMTSFSSANVTAVDGLFGKFSTCLGDAAHRADNLIQYTRGESDKFTASTGSACRSRVVDSTGNIWKLGDIINSTPKVIDYTPHSVLFTGANDGMIHAFQVGKIRKDGISTSQSVRLCDKNTGACTTSEIGKELWAFIPKNAMPYLKYLADPDYCHLYVVDLGTYYINDNGRKILIGGMRFGGATTATYEQGSNSYWTGDTDRDGTINTDSDGDKLQIIPETVGGCTSTTPANCQGVSSYFALDVTDPNSPVLLWEYSHPGLGFSYSGPAWIKRGAKRYVMFASGPTNYKGYAENQNLKLFILEVDSNFRMVDPDTDGNVDEHVFKIDGVGATGYVKDSTITQFTSGFGGRMFTDGVDSNKDGKTDAVFFGVNWFTSVANGWKGNVLAVVPTDDPPTSGSTVNWQIEKTFNDGQAPITSKVTYGDCFGVPTLYFGSGRWFYKLDEPGKLIASDTNSLYGIDIAECMAAITDTDTKTKCTMSFNTSHSSHIDECPTDNPGNHSWQISTLAPNDGTYMKERVISDPTFSDNMAFFTTAQPSADICAFGGRSRIFALNCATGNNIFSTNCPGFIVDIPAASLLLQLSGGNIEDTKLDSTYLTEGNNKATGWFVGMPPESGATFLPPTGLLKGKIILWIEH